jgi:dTDP-4-dehydrorhamnose 3,5-epimerase-like enzyme
MNIQVKFSDHLGNNHGTFRDTQGTFMERSGNIQRTFREHQGTNKVLVNSSISFPYILRALIYVV